MQAVKQSADKWVYHVMYDDGDLNVAETYTRAVPGQATAEAASPITSAKPASTAAASHSADQPLTTNNLNSFLLSPVSHVSCHPARASLERCLSIHADVWGAVSSRDPQAAAALAAADIATWSRP